MQLDQPDRDLGDLDRLRGDILDSSLSAVRGWEPLKNHRHTLSVSDVRYEGPQHYSPREENEAILTGNSLGVKMRAQLSLQDNLTGQPIGSKRITLGQVPWLTPRGTFIHNGVDYAVGNQKRLKPGAFVRIKRNGELEAHVNVLPGKGFAHRIFMDPETEVFKMQVGQAELPLISLLRTMGATDRNLTDAWGNEAYSSNVLKDTPSALKKLYGKLVRQPNPGADPVAQREAIRQVFEQMELDPRVTQRTLGGPYSRVDMPTLLRITQKLQAVSRGEEQPDDRDNQANQVVLGPEDLISERLRRPSSEMRRMFWRASFANSMDRFGANPLKKAMASALLHSGLANALEEVNPAELLDQRHRITPMGEGGIPSIDAIPDESRAVNPSHFNYVDPVQTPESSKIGVEGRLSYRVRKGRDGNLYAPFVDARTGQESYLNAEQLEGKILAYPQELNSQQPYVAAIVNGKMQYVPRDKVDFTVRDMTDSFGPMASLVPLKSMSKGHRVSMGSRMLTQALALTDPESPFVQAGRPGGGSFEEQFGRQMGAVFSDQGGYVKAVTPEEVVVVGPTGQETRHPLYDNFVLNRKSFLQQTPVVQVGQQLAPGQLVARSNFTDAKGATALGKNVRVAYVADKGHNYEDAVSISESLAKRLTSEHAYQHNLDVDEGTKLGKHDYQQLFPGKLKKEQLDLFDDNGLIKPGSTVNYNDPLALAARERPQWYGKVGRRAVSFSDAAPRWTHHTPGVVTNAVKTKNGVLVVVKVQEPMQVGDKASGRWGDKGVVGRIIPDDQMPRDKDGKPFEALVNPLGVITRTNPSQVLEAVLGKIVEKTGREPYQIGDFAPDDMVAFAEQELAKHGLSDLEDIEDPATGKTIKQVLTGNRFLMKLHHQAEHKLAGRGENEGYTADDTPAKGGSTGGKRVGMLELNALLSHGAYQNIADVSNIRGQKNERYWSQTMAGFAPPAAETPPVYRKFLAELQGAGIYPLRKNNRLQLMALTNEQVDEFAGDRELQNVETVDWRDMQKPIPGGLFDTTLHGPDGDRWSSIRLHEPLPNPVMEEPARRLLGLTEQKFRETLAGRHKLNAAGDTGAAGIAKVLSQLNVPNEIARTTEIVRNGRKGQRDEALRKLIYLRGAESTGVHPGQWILNRVPVLPPKLRPVSMLQGSNTPVIADPNLLYKEVWDANDNLKQIEGRVDDIGDERLALYDAFKAVTGLGDPIQPQHRQQQVQGLLRHIFGSSSKYGTVQRKLLGSTVDLVGRSVVVPDPDLDLDEVAIPENSAWEVYRPFVVRRLVRRGMPRLQALTEVKDRSERARSELVQEMGQRPVLVNRAPSLHRYSIMAFRPRLTPDNALRANPLIHKGFTLDHDGDQMNFHVPASDAAVREAYDRLLPSRNLLAVSNFRAHQVPQLEFLGGLYAASSRKKNRPAQVFATIAEAILAGKRGQLDDDDPVAIVDTVGI